MKKTIKILSFVILFAVVLASFPTMGFAAENQENFSVSVVTEPENAGSVIVDKTQAAAGETLSYSVEPVNGYKIESIFIGDNAIAVDNPYEQITGTFVVDEDTIVCANFAACDTYQINTSVNYTKRGTISKSTSVTENGSVTVTSSANSGYYLKDLKVDGVSVGAKYTYTITNVKKNHEVKAVFAAQKRIMIDAGHYANYNRSPVYKAYYESRAMWDLHEYLKAELLTYNGIQVGVTRTNEEKDKTVYSRGTSGKGYDLLISLHSNAGGSSSTDYPLIITQKGDTKDALAQALGKVIYETMGTKQSYKVQQKLNKNGVTEYYGVLRGAKAVGTKAFIIEHSFHTNYVAAKWLYNQSNLKQMAVAEAAVIADYYGLSKIEADSSSASDSESSVAEKEQASTATGSTSSQTVVTSTEKVKVLVSELNMRKSYTTSSKSMGKAKKNTTYQLKAKTKDGLWGQLKTNGYWIYLKGYTKVVTSTTSSKVVTYSGKVKVTVSELNMRKSYTTSSKSMGKAKKNTTYQLKAKTKDGLWGQLKTNGYWIYLKGYTKAV